MIRLLALVFILVASPALAQSGPPEPNAFDPFMGDHATQCVDLEKVVNLPGVKSKRMGDKALYFFLGIWYITPPVSPKLPVGDTLYVFLDEGSGATMAGATADGKLCTRSMFPPSLIEILMRVDKGEKSEPGDTT